MAAIVPSFILRGLDPVFWARVQAKAKAEGLQVKAVILKLLAQWLGPAVLLLLTIACRPPLATTPADVVPPDLSAPHSLSLVALPGNGDQAGHAAISLKVQNILGTPLVNLPVLFTTDVGTLSADQVATNAEGVAETELTASATAKITATAGGKTANTLVVAIAPPPPFVPSPRPPPPPPPPPAPTPQPGYSVTLTANPTTVIAGNSATLSASVTPLNGASLPTNYAWDCDGNGTTDANTYPADSQSCTYSTAGTFTPRVVASNSATSGTASATVTVTQGFTVSLTCTPGDTSPVDATDCNVTVSYGGTILPGTTVTNVEWNWGDGSTSTTAGPATSYTYPTAGSYTVFAMATAMTSDGLKTAIGSRSIVVP